jgi:hypothetical protein
MWEKIRTVMRWVGPRIMLYHLLEVVKHLIRRKI